MSLSQLNPSSNRWTFFPTVNYSYTPDQGWTWLETYLSTKVFTTNADYRVGGASSLAQKRLFLVDGVGQGNAANTLRLGAGIGVSVWAGGDVVLNYERVSAKPAWPTGCASRSNDHQTGLISVRCAAPEAREIAGTVLAFAT